MPCCERTKEPVTSYTKNSKNGDPLVKILNRATLNMLLAPINEHELLRTLFDSLW